MPVMKQKSIQPARNIPHAEGILMYNGTGAAIPANTIVRIDASAPTGQSLNMNDTVNATTLALGGGVPLWITRHAVPAGKYGVVLPWAILSGQNTAAITAGNPVYLQDGGGYGPTVGTQDRIIGVCLVSDANNGVVFLNFSVGGYFIP